MTLIFANFTLDKYEASIIHRHSKKQIINNSDMFLKSLPSASTMLANAMQEFLTIFASCFEDEENVKLLAHCYP